MKRFLFFLAIVSMVVTPSLSAFDVDLYGRIGVLQMSHPDFADKKTGVELDVGGTFGLSRFFSVDIRTGYGFVPVKPLEINNNKVSWKYMKTVPVVVSLVITPLNFLPIISPYIIAGLGSWRIMDPSKSSFQGFGGSAGVGISLKGGCLGFDVRALYEKPDFNSSYKDWYISIAPVLYLGF